MRIGILNYNYAVPTSVTGPADIFAALVRTYPIVTGNELNADFKIEFITEKKGLFWKTPFGEKEQQPIENCRRKCLPTQCLFYIAVSASQ